MLTIAQLVRHIKSLLDQDSALRNVWAEGEVSNFKRASSGHCYFTLKDPEASISCVMWRNEASALTRLPIDGEQVLAHGYVSVYAPQGRVQFYVDHLEPAGLGRLYQALEELKARLSAEGLFSQERKRPLPRWPARIGVVTSPKAAALQDILRTLAARYPLASVLLAPAAVQGLDAPAQIVAAVQLLNRWSQEVEPVDLIILARGGGSIEELWAFNDERVVRALAMSAIPIVSGVGHETDFTLADLVADLRAPTPTGAATLAVPDRQELVVQVAAQRRRATTAALARLVASRQDLGRLEGSLRRESPRSQVAGHRQQVDELSQFATRAMAQRLRMDRTRLDGLGARLQSLNPAAVLARGYAIVRKLDDDEIVTSVGQVAPGDRLRVSLRDGEINSQVL